jgi:hypothetical protein
MTWEIAKREICPISGQEALLLEQRAYAWQSSQPDAAPYLVEARRCSRDLECNSNSHIYCRWAFSNPLVDPYE